MLSIIAPISPNFFNSIGKCSGLIPFTLPVFLTDSTRSQAKDVAHTNFADLENITHFDRQPWIEKMAQMHWTLDELKDGTAWKHLRQWADKPL